MLKLVLEKAEEPEIKLPTSVGLSKKQKELQKINYFCFIDYAKAFDCVITINCGKFWKRWEYQTTLPASWEIYMQVKKQQLESDMKWQLVLNWKRSVFIPVPKKGNAKNVHTTAQLHSSHTLAK